MVMIWTGLYPTTVTGEWFVCMFVCLTIPPIHIPPVPTKLAPRNVQGPAFACGDYWWFLSFHFISNV